MVEIDMGDYVQALAVLVLVIGLILLTARLVRRFGTFGTAGTPPAGKRRLQVLETRMLDPRHRLVLVALDDREHLLLVGAGTALRVDTLPAADQIDSRLSDGVGRSPLDAAVQPQRGASAVARPSPC